MKKKEILQIVQIRPTIFQYNGMKTIDPTIRSYYQIDCELAFAVFFLIVNEIYHTWVFIWISKYVEWIQIAQMFQVYLAKSILNNFP